MKTEMINNNNNNRNNVEVKPIQRVFEEINATVVCDEHLKRRTRSGGFVSWPQHGDGQNAASRNNGSPAPQQP